MPTIVALTPTAGLDPTRAAWYPVRLGPLRFTCLVGDVPEPLGDKLEAVGAALVPGERGPRSAQITLPVTGSLEEVDHRAAGLVLRRQVRALLENSAWKQQGLYFEAGWDPETAAWLMVGGGQLTEEQRGFAFGDWRLTLDDAYLVGRPAGHRRGRRITIADRASGTVATDTRGRLYTTDLSGVAPVAPGAAIPGDIELIRGRGFALAAAAGPSVDGRRLFSTYPANSLSEPTPLPPINGEVVTWRPNTAVIVDAREREALTEDAGAVRAWAMPGTPGAGTPAGDRDPTQYGWEQVMGQLDDPYRKLAVENGWVRCVWLGAVEGGGLRVQYWSNAEDRYVTSARFAVWPSSSEETRVLEVTPERAVIGVRTSSNDVVFILQRGWPGPRIEVYSEGQSNRLASATTGTATDALVSPLVWQVEGDECDAFVALTLATLAYGDSPGDLPTADSIGAWWHPSGTLPVVVQVDAVPDQADANRIKRVQRLARWDVRSIPVLTAA